MAEIIVSLGRSVLLGKIQPTSQTGTKTPSGSVREIKVNTATKWRYLGASRGK